MPLPLPAAAAAAPDPVTHLQPAAPAPGDALVTAALKVLRQPDGQLKAAWTLAAARLWRSGAISRVADEGFDAAADVPDRPARQPGQVTLVAPGDVPKLGRGGTLASRQAIIHSLVHIELAAVDLSWDIIARFGADVAYRHALPRAFFDDFVQVAADEASHFSLLKQRLEALGSHYGAFPAHDGLWESAMATAHSLPARLAVEHCVHEARGLDVLPLTIGKFRNAGDAETADLLEHTVYQEEVSHCAAGVRWLTHLHQHAAAARPTQQQQREQHQQHDASNSGGGGGAECACACGHGWAADAARHSSPDAWFHSLIRRHFKGSLKPPFNEAARAQAGFTPTWYLPLSSAAAAAAVDGAAAAAGGAAAAIADGATAAAGATVSKRAAASQAAASKLPAALQACCDSGGS